MSDQLVDQSPKSDAPAPGTAPLDRTPLFQPAAMPSKLITLNVQADKCNECLRYSSLAVQRRCLEGCGNPVQENLFKAQAIVNALSQADHHLQLADVTSNAIS